MCHPCFLSIPSQHSAFLPTKEITTALPQGHSLAKLTKGKEGGIFQRYQLD